MNPEEIIRFANLIQAAPPSQLIWTTLNDVAELANTILTETTHVEYDWNIIFNAFDGEYNLNQDDKINAINAVRVNIGQRYPEINVLSTRVSAALLGLAYIVRISNYNGLPASWERIHSNIVGAYNMNGISID